MDKMKTMESLRNESFALIKGKDLSDSYDITIVEQKGTPLKEFVSELTKEVETAFPGVTIDRDYARYCLTYSVRNAYNSSGVDLVRFRIKKQKISKQRYSYFNHYNCTGITIEVANENDTVQDIIDKAMKIANDYYNEAMPRAEAVISMFRHKNVTPQEVEQLYDEYRYLNRLEKRMVDSNFYTQD